MLTFTAAVVFGGLIAAAHFAESLGETELAEEYRQGARQMREAIDTYLYLEQENLSELIEIEKCTACGHPKYQMSRE